MKKIPLLAACLFILLLCLPGYANDPHFRHYNNKQGLSHNTVYCSLQDQRGFMWFGTEDGLNRFDGHTFKIYRHNSYNPNSLPNDCIVNLFESSDEKIWIFTARGTCYYDYRTDTFHPFRLSSGENESESFFAGTEDKDRNLWFIDYNRIVRYNPADSSSRTYPAEEFFHPAIITLTNDGKPLFSDRQSLYTYKVETDNFQKIPFLNETQISNQIALQAVCQIPGLGILGGTNQAGLLLYKYQAQRVVTIIPEIQVRAIIPYNTTIYWIASESGIYIYNTQDQTITNLRKSLTNEYAIADNAVYSLTKDREGGFSYFIGGKTHPQLLGNAIREITPDRYGNLWLGTEDNGINSYNPRTGEITNYSYNNPSHPLSATNIHGLLAVDNQLWVGTFNKGIDVLDIPSGKIIKHYSRENSQTNLNSNFILCFYKTRENEFLVGTSNGLMIYNKQTESFSPWNNIYALIRQIYQDSRGDIWVATSNGIYHYLRKENKVEQYRSGSNKSESIGNNNTTSVFEDSKGRIWVTTVSGLSLFNEEAQSFNRITTDNGLPSNIVYRIVEDDSHNFWLSTANGLVRFNPETYAMRTYTYTDGLHETQFNYSSSYQAPDGTIYMGTINGMLSFNPSQFKEDTFMPPMYITGINLPDNEENKYNLPTSSIEDTKVLKLPYNASTFTLSYVALSYTSPDAIRYAYKLEGVDKDWNYMEQNKNVTFANLSPGEYTFKVKSTNSSGLWQDNEQSLQIIITPPFWATGWAIALYIIAGILLAYGVIRFIFRIQQKKLEEEQERATVRQQHEVDEMKLRFFTNVSHEFRTPLTLIMTPLEKLMKTEKDMESQQILKLIYRNADRLLKLVNQLLDFRKIDMQGDSLVLSTGDIVPFVRDVAYSFKELSEQKRIHFSFSSVFTSLPMKFDTDKVFKIVSNLLSNAFKFTPEGGTISVTLSLRLEKEGENKLVIEVSDSGIGIPADKQGAIFDRFYQVASPDKGNPVVGTGIGLHLCREFVRMHHGTITVKSEPGAGSTFTVTLPVIPLDNQDIISAPEGIAEGDILPPVEEHAEIADKDASPAERPTLLVVDDNTDFREFMKLSLSGVYSVLTAADGEDAWKLIPEELPDMVISDVMMPITDGITLCRRIKGDIRTSHIPVILLTAKSAKDSQLVGLEAGADDYISKPFNMEMLLLKVRHLIEMKKKMQKAFMQSSTMGIALTEVQASSMDEELMRKAIGYIEEQIANPELSVERLSREMGMSRVNFYKKCLSITGKTPVELIRTVRLKRAAQLLEKSQMRVNEVALECGFNDVKLFRKYFKDEFGRLPSDYHK